MTDGACPHLVQDGDFYFCGVYTDRPEACKNHEYPHHICPIGADVLGIHDMEVYRRRVDVGWEKAQKLAKGVKRGL